MRNEVHDDNSVVARGARRRKQAIIGVAGLAVLGAGAFLVTSQVADDAGTGEPAALAPVAPTGSAEPVASPSLSAEAPSAAAPASAGATMPATPVETTAKSRQESIAEVRRLARQPNNNVRRPLPALPAKPVEDKDLSVQEVGTIKRDKATLKMVSARQDLTGQRELSWVADEGEAVGDARCTQKVRFMQGAPAVDKPTLLVCWRTSAARSVYTIAVDLAGKPSRERSVAAIDKEWDRLGG